MSEMMRAQVSRANIAGKLAEGYTFVRGDGPDGRAWVGDSVLMEIPKERFEEMHKERRESYETMSRLMRSGHHPVSDTGEQGVAIKHSREEVRPTGRVRRKAE